MVGSNRLPPSARATRFRRLSRTLSAVLVLAAAGVLLAAPARAQNVSNPRALEVVPARIAVLERLQLTKLYDMDFGKIAIATNGGTVVMTPSRKPTCTASGTLVHSGVCRPAEFGGAGEEGRTVRFKAPPGNSLKLTGPGQNMTLSGFTLAVDHGLTLVTKPGGGKGGATDTTTANGWTTYRISDRSGIFGVWVGGTLTVNNNQAPGVYRAEFDVRVDYE